MGLDVTYRLCRVLESNLGTDLCNTVITKVTSQKTKPKQNTKPKNKTRKISANEIQC